jgi:hypothetical protein
MKGSRVCAVFSLVFLLLAGGWLFVFACVHYSNWWSLFIAIPCIAAFISPAICYAYNTDDMGIPRDVQIDPAQLATCREVGWSTGGVLSLLAYMIPVLAWYNSGFHWGGVLMVYGTLTCLSWSYILWLRVFVFQ